MSCDDEKDIQQSARDAADDRARGRAPAVFSATKEADCSLASCPSPLPCPREVAQLAIGSTAASRQSHRPLR